MVALVGHRRRGFIQKAQAKEVKKITAPLNTNPKSPNEHHTETLNKKHVKRNGPCPIQFA